MSCASRAIIAVAVFALPIAAAAAPPITGCDSVGNARPVCIFQNPEDMVALPSARAVIVSEYGSMEGTIPGRLSLFVLATDEKRVLFRGGDATGAGPGSWGETTCPGPPPASFSPHGIHLSKRSDGRLQLLAVQHGGRESVEFFEVVGSGTVWALGWRGCAVVSDDSWLNSVVALPEGGFLTTSLMSRTGSMEDVVASLESGKPTGSVLEWTAPGGWRHLEPMRTAMPNGIEISADGRKFFLNASGVNEVWRVDRETLEIEARASVPTTDNARFGTDGSLLVASLIGAGNDDFGSCTDLPHGSPCPLEFQIVQVDPESMETKVLYRNGGPPMGGGTVGLKVGNEILIGSFGGDRIVRVTLD